MGTDTLAQKIERLVDIFNAHPQYVERGLRSIASGALDHLIEDALEALQELEVWEGASLKAQILEALQARAAYLLTVGRRADWV